MLLGESLSLLQVGFDNQDVEAGILHISQSEGILEIFDQDLPGKSFRFEQFDNFFSFL